MTTRAIVGDAGVIKRGARERCGVFVAGIAIAASRGRRVIFGLTIRAAGGETTTMTTIATRTRDQGMIEQTRVG